MRRHETEWESVEDTPPFIVGEKLKKGSVYHVLYANETKSRQFTSRKAAEKFRKYLNKESKKYR